MITRLFTLSAFIICSVMFGQTLLNENFENGIPAGWEIRTSSPTQNWKTAGPGTYAFLKTKVAVIDGDNTNYAPQDEWLITPSMDFTNAASPAMDFSIASNLFWLVTQNTTDFFIKASTDGGTTWTQIWDDTQFPINTPNSFNVYRLRLDLGQFKGQPDVKIAFQQKASGVSAPSLVVSVILDNILVNAEQDKYCIVYFAENKVAPITNVTFSNISNTSSSTTDGTDPHQMFLDQVAEVNKGDTYTISVTANKLGGISPYLTAFIDWNQNGTFMGPEVISLGRVQDAATPLTASVKIPDFAKPGLTRMRIISSTTANTTACYESGSGGQAEEYMVLISGSSVDPADDGCTIYHTGSYEDGSQIRSTVRSANDFVIKANKQMNINKVEISVFNQLPVADLYFYKDDNGKPGEMIQSYVGLVPASQVLQSDVTDNQAYKDTFILPQPLMINAENHDQIFWLGINSQSSAYNFWSAADVLTNASPAMASTDAGVTWQNIYANFDGAFVIFGECETLNASDIATEKVSYYPNPVKDFLNIKAKKEIKNIVIYNLDGRAVKESGRLINGQLNMTSLNTGVYIIKIAFADNSSETIKIIKKQK